MGNLCDWMISRCLISPYEDDEDDEGEDEGVVDGELWTKNEGG